MSTELLHLTTVECQQVHVVFFTQLTRNWAKSFGQRHFIVRVYHENSLCLFSEFANTVEQTNRAGLKLPENYDY